MAAGPIPGVVYAYDVATRQYKAKGRPSLGASGREQLVYGTYRPEDTSTTGPTGPMTSVYVSQAGVASTNFANGYGGIWVVNSSNYPLTPVLMPNGQVQNMAVFEGLDIHGMIDAYVPVLLKNSRTRGRAGGTKVAGQWWSGLQIIRPGAAGSAGSWVIDSEMRVDEPTELHIAGVNGGAGVRIERANIHGGIDGYRFGDVNNGCKPNSVIGTWIHDQQWITGSFAPQPEGPHCDAASYGPNIAYSGVQTILGSYFDARVVGHPVNDATVNNGPSCIMIPGSTNTAFRLEVRKSWLRWGWFPLNSGGTPHPDSTILLEDVVGYEGWFERNGVRYHEVSTSAWNTRTTRTRCTDGLTGGAWRRTA